MSKDRFVDNNDNNSVTARQCRNANPRTDQLEAPEDARLRFCDPELYQLLSYLASTYSKLKSMLVTTVIIRAKIILSSSANALQVFSYKYCHHCCLVPSVTIMFLFCPLATTVACSLSFRVSSTQ